MEWSSCPPIWCLVYWQRFSVCFNHMSSSRWEANYRRGRTTLSSFLPCSDFLFVFFLKTFAWFSRQIPHWGECSACQRAALFRLDQKAPPSPLYYTFFLFATFLWLSLLCKFLLIFFRHFLYFHPYLTAYSNQGVFMCFTQTWFYFNVDWTVIVFGPGLWAQFCPTGKDRSLCTVRNPNLDFLFL